MSMDEAKDVALGFMALSRDDARAYGSVDEIAYNSRKLARAYLTLLAERDRLKTALEPFARIGAVYNKPHYRGIPDDAGQQGWTVNPNDTPWKAEFWYVNIGHLRNASNALTSSKGEAILEPDRGLTRKGLE